MSTQSFDAERYKTGQIKQWDSAAAGWRKWWQSFEQGAQVLSDRLVELAEIKSGLRVLDVATGIGEPAVTAARRVGPEGRVVATDQSPQMLTIARDRAAELELQNIDFREMDADSLDLPEGTFNAVLCRWGLMLLPNLAGSLSQMWRLLIPGGYLAAAVWDVAAKVPVLSLPVGVALPILQIPPPPPGTPNFFSLADTTALEQSFREAGFAEVRSERLTVTYELSSAEEFVQRSCDVNVVINNALATQPVKQQEAVRRAIADAAQEYATGDGRIRIPNESICVVGRR